jgi:sulfoxide reductase heme-binding subunit YedZ
VISTNVLWFTARGAGLSALLSFSLATAFGAYGSARIASAPTRVVVQYLHRTAAVVGLLLIVVHVSTLLLDSKAHVGLAGALIPFASQYRPNAVALGSIAAYVLILVAALGAARGSLTSSPLAVAGWRVAHAFAYPAWAIAVVHGLLAGTDRAQAWMIWITVGCVLVVMISGALRLVAHPSDAEGKVATPSRLSGSGARR